MHATTIALGLQQNVMVRPVAEETPCFGHRLREIRLESLAASFLLARRFYCKLEGEESCHHSHLAVNTNLH